MNYEKRVETVLINNFTNINNKKRTITSHINWITQSTHDENTNV